MPPSRPLSSCRHCANILNESPSYGTLLPGPIGFPQDCLHSARKALAQYSWPGNLRELHHITNTTVRRSAGSEITLGMLPDTVRSAPIGATMIERAERHALLQALQKSSGNRSQAAAILGVSRATIYRKIKQYKLQD
jgi:transcriptional regulator of acetoin/glycerol metabolism